MEEHHPLYFAPAPRSMDLLFNHFQGMENQMLQRKFYKLAAVFLLLFSPLLAHGEIYKYIDEDGIEHYTNTPPSRPQIEHNEPAEPQEITKIDGLSILEASNAQKQLVQSALGDDYPIIKAAIVKSKHHRNGYYIGAVFEAIGIDPPVGIWFIGGNWEKPSTLCLSVNGVASGFSGMKKASETKSAAYVFDPEAKALKKYLKK